MSSSMMTPYLSVSHFETLMEAVLIQLFGLGSWSVLNRCLVSNHTGCVKPVFSDRCSVFFYIAGMQMRELNKQQYTYLKDVLGVEAVVSIAATQAVNYQRLVLLSAPLSYEEKDLLAKITQAFGWDKFETAVAGDLTESIQAKQIFIFGNEAKKYFDANLKTEDAIVAPSLAILLRDTAAKKLLWQQMKQFMEA